MITRLLNLCLALASSTVIAAEEQTDAQQPQKEAKPYETIVSTPMFSQSFVHGLPKGWRLVQSGKSPDGSSFSQGYALEGQSPSDWTELLTVTGFKDMAKLPNASPSAFIEKTARHKQTLCPKSMVAISGGNVVFGTRRGHVAIIGCGRLPTDMGGMTAGEGEIGLYVIVQGDNDMYVIQRLQRVSPFEPKAQPITPQEFSNLLQSLFPIGVCEISDSPDQCKPKLGGKKGAGSGL